MCDVNSEPQLQGWSPKQLTFQAFGQKLHLVVHHICQYTVSILRTGKGTQWHKVIRPGIIVLISEPTHPRYGHGLDQDSWCEAVSLCQWQKWPIAVAAMPKSIANADGTIRLPTCKSFQLSSAHFMPIPSFAELAAGLPRGRTQNRLGSI